MTVLSVQEERVTLQLSIDELLMIHNALNEVCNGIEVPEFHARMGAEREQVHLLLSRVSAALGEVTMGEKEDGEK